MKTRDGLIFVNLSSLTLLDNVFLIERGWGMTFFVFDKNFLDPTKNFYKKH